MKQYDEIRAPEIEALTPLERLPQSAQDIYAAEERAAEETFGRYEGIRRQRDSLRINIAESYTQIGRNDRAQKPSQIVADREAAKIAKATAALKALDSKMEDEQRFRPGSMATVTREFLSSAAANSKKWKARNTTDQLIEGQTPDGMSALCRAKHKHLIAESKVIHAAPKTAAEIKLDARHLIDFHAAKLGQTISGLRRVTFSDRVNRFENRPDYLPEIRIADGAGGLSTFIDGAGLLLALFGDEATERLIALALRDHNEATALDEVERQRRHLENQAATLENAYRAEFWHRYCLANGINPGPRVTSNPLAILDIVEA